MLGGHAQDKVKSSLYSTALACLLLPLSDWSPMMLSAEYQYCVWRLFLTRCSIGIVINFWHSATLRKHLPRPTTVRHCAVYIINTCLNFSYAVTQYYVP